MVEDFDTYEDLEEMFFNPAANHKSGNDQQNGKKAYTYVTHMSGSYFNEIQKRAVDNLMNF